MSKYSVLMSIYKNEVPSNFEVALKSILSQEIAPSEIVIVCDGPLTDELDATLNKYKEYKKPTFNIIRLPENVGLGTSLAVGLKECSNEFVLRMDTDDIAFSYRSKYELEALEEGFDIVGGNISEFEDGDENKIIAIRKVPLTQEEIYKFVRKRTPFNHPSVAYRKSFILSVGNYSNLRKSQDWELWVRCINGGAKVKNFDKVFINMRSGKEMRKRRGGKLYNECQTYILKEIRSLKWISGFRYHYLKFLYKCYSIMPVWLKGLFTNSFLRKK